MTDMCSDCGRERWPTNRTAKASDCLARESERGRADCCQITIHRLRAELMALKAPPAYPSVVIFPDLETPQNVHQPTSEVWLEVAPSGFAERVWDYQSVNAPYIRRVRYVLAPPAGDEA